MRDTLPKTPLQWLRRATDLREMAVDCRDEWTRRELIRLAGECERQARGSDPRRAK